VADDPRLAALAGVILPWVAMPASLKEWTQEEYAAYASTGRWHEGVAAAKPVRAERIARDVLAFLDGPGATAVEGAESAVAATATWRTEAAEAGQVVDLITALRRSVERARQARGDTPGTRKPATPPRGPSGASPSADGTAR
jgi:hypothetical protein